MTFKLYDQDPHQQTFKASVISCVPCDAGYRVVLDQTAFFPGGGGQPCDKGHLSSSEVLSVMEDKEIIYHIVSHPLPAGRVISGSINWPFRFTNMQQHSGEHILSGIVHQMKGYNNVGFHMNDTFTTIDFDGPLSPAELEEAENRANQIIYDNIPVRVFYPSPEELSQMTYRSKKSLTGSVRIVQVGDYDLCACCAPHVSFTGEVGLIKIIAHENYKGGVRLTILCGARAMAHYHQQTQLLHRLSIQLSAPAEKLEDALDKQDTEKKVLKDSIIRLSEELIQARLSQISSQASSCCFLETALNEAAARRLVNILAASHSGLMAVLLPLKDNGFRYIIGSHNQDLLPFCQEWNRTFSGRGGGSSQMIQGTVWGDPEEMKDFIAAKATQ